MFFHPPHLDECRCLDYLSRGSCARHGDVVWMVMVRRSFMVMVWQVWLGGRRGWGEACRGVEEKWGWVL